MVRNQYLTLTTLLFALGLFCASSHSAFSQAPQQSRMNAAAELAKAGKWEEAAKAYETIVADEPTNAPGWYQLGMARFSLQQFAPAAEALRKNIALSNNPGAMYNLACAHARMGNRDEAINWLNQSIKTGLPPFVNPAQDTDLATLQDDSRFKESLVVLDKQRRPCNYSEAARQFDFWLGDWDVFNTQGQGVGSSSIQRIADGCGVLENWTGRFGGNGKSINFFDPGSNKWHQYWIGSNGAPLRYAGVYQDGAMRYAGEPAAAKDAPLRRLTFFNVDANTVRQLAEQSTDGGKTWTTSYDFKYVRKKLS